MLYMHVIACLQCTSQLILLASLHYEVLSEVTRSEMIYAKS